MAHTVTVLALLNDYDCGLDFEDIHAELRLRGFSIAMTESLLDNLVRTHQITKRGRVYFAA